MNEWIPIQRSGINFYHRVVYFFNTSRFFYRMSGHFSYTADQLSRTSEPSCENGLKLKPRRYHTATTRNSGQTWKVVRVRFPVRGHIWSQYQLRTTTLLFHSNPMYGPYMSQGLPYDSHSFSLVRVTNFSSSKMKQV